MTTTDVHLYAWRPSAVAVPTRGREIRDKLRLGAWVCLMCHGLESWHSHWCAPCPGIIPPALGCLSAPPLTSANPFRPLPGVTTADRGSKPSAWLSGPYRAIHHIVAGRLPAIIELGGHA